MFRLPDVLHDIDRRFKAKRLESIKISSPFCKILEFVFDFATRAHLFAIGVDFFLRRLNFFIGSRLSFCAPLVRPPTMTWNAAKSVKFGEGFCFLAVLALARWRGHSREMKRIFSRKKLKKNILRLAS
jgi:hypothetical protein